jgi:hypothetical protein
VLGLVAVDAVLHLVAEVPYQPLHWPSCCVSQGTNGVAFDLVGKFFEHVNLSKISVSFLDSLK